MKLARLTSLALAAALVIPAAAQAQTEVLNFVGVKNTTGPKVGSAFTGPYVAEHMPFSQATAFDIYCIDYDHTISAGQFTVRYITFQEAVGVYSTQAQRQLGTGSWGVAELRAAAYLTQQLTLPNKANWATVHGSIWSMFSSNPVLNPYTGSAAAAVAFAGGDASYDSQYFIAVDNKVFDPAWTASMESTLKQGFIVADGDVTVRVITPEPSTYVLMGAGLFAVGFVSRRRRTA